MALLIRPSEVRVVPVCLQVTSLITQSTEEMLMHLMYITTNVLFALELNCDCYVQSMRKVKRSLLPAI